MHVYNSTFAHIDNKCLMLIPYSSEKPKLCYAMHSSARLCYALIRLRWNRNENKTKPFDKKIKQLFQQHKYCNNYVCRGYERVRCNATKTKFTERQCKMHRQGNFAQMKANDLLEDLCRMERYDRPNQPAVNKSKRQHTK